MCTRLMEIRQGLNMNKRQFADFLRTKYTTYVGYESGAREPGSDFLSMVASKCNTTTDYLLGITDNPSPFPKNVMRLPAMQKVPIVGEIACGVPLLAEENVDGHAVIPQNIRADFCLTCKGDSMVGARIYDGDLVCIRQQSSVQNGEIAAVLIDDEATLKRVYYFPGHYLELRAENPAFETLRYTGEELLQVRILGKAVYFISKIQ